MLALHRALDAGYQVDALLAMFDETGERSRSHALPPHLMQAQADALGIPLVTRQASWTSYEAVFTEQLRAFAAQGITHGTERRNHAAELNLRLFQQQLRRFQLARQFVAPAQRFVALLAGLNHVLP